MATPAGRRSRVSSPCGHHAQPGGALATTFVRGLQLLPSGSESEGMANLEHWPRSGGSGRPAAPPEHADRRHEHASADAGATRSGHTRSSSGTLSVAKTTERGCHRRIRPRNLQCMSATATVHDEQDSGAGHTTATATSAARRHPAGPRTPSRARRHRAQPGALVSSPRPQSPLSRQAQEPLRCTQTCSDAEPRDSSANAAAQGRVSAIDSNRSVF